MKPLQFFIHFGHSEMIDDKEQAFIKETPTASARVFIAGLGDVEIKFTVSTDLIDRIKSEIIVVAEKKLGMVAK